MSDESVPYTAEAVAVATNGHTPTPTVVPLRRLSAMDRLFEATGLVTLRCGSVTQTLEIQSVDIEMVESLCRPYRPEVPAIVELQQGKRTRMPNYADQGYIDKNSEYQRIFSYVFVLCALRADIYDKRDRLVWNTDNTVHEIEAGKQALRDMGIVDSQLAILLDAIRSLTQDVEERQVGE